MNSEHYDVIIIGSGVAGALMAFHLAKAKVKVLLLEAGGVVPDSAGREVLVNNYAVSPSKGQDSPYTDIINNHYYTSPEPVVAPQPLDEPPPGEKPYYIQKGDPNAGRSAGEGGPFKSQYERLVGGSAWHWQGIILRMLPNDFRLHSQYKLKGVRDWPISYADLERWYREAEVELGVAGDQADADKVDDLFQAGRSKRGFPMPAITKSYLDHQFEKWLKGASYSEPKELVEGAKPADIPLWVTTIPQARNSVPFDGRPACDGRLTCVPLCPTKAKYEAIFHVDKAVRAGAELRSNALVTKLEADADGKITTVWYLPKEHANPRPARVRKNGIVVLAANGIENPRILLYSELAKTKSSELIGCYLMDHPIKSSFALAGEPVYGYRGPQTTCHVETFRDGDFRRYRGAFKISLRNDGWSGPMGGPRGIAQLGLPPRPQNRGTVLDIVHNQHIIGHGLRNKLKEHCALQVVLNSACEQLPVKESCVQLSKTENDKFGIPKPELHYLVDDPTQYTRKAFKAIVKAHEQIFNLIKSPQDSIQLNNADLNDDKTPLNYLGSGHIMGTTTMGDNPENSVVDKDCRAWDHKNLFIAGSSVFVTGSTANPTLTLAALALRAVEGIKLQLRQG